MIGFEKLNRVATDAVGWLASRPREMTGGLLLVILVATHAAVWLLPSVFQPMQDQFIDRLFRLREQIPAMLPDYDGTVFLVPIDDESVQRRDGYYLGREDYGRLIRNLNRAGVSAQFLDVIFAAPETEEGDRLLTEALTEAGNAFVGMAVGASPHGRGEWPEIPNVAQAEILARQRWTNVEVRGSTQSLLESTRYFTTFPEVAAAAGGMGHLDLIPDRDGVVRRVPLVVRDRDGFLPSLHLLVLTSYLDIEPAEIRIEPGVVTLRDIVIPVNARGEMRVNFRGAWGALETYPFSSVYTASDDRFMMEDLREVLKDRIAVVSWFSTGRGDVGAVPTDPVYPRAGIWSEAMNTILTGQFVHELSSLWMLLLVELPMLLVLFWAATRLTTIPSGPSGAG